MNEPLTKDYGAQHKKDWGYRHSTYVEIENADGTLARVPLRSVYGVNPELKEPK